MNPTEWTRQSAGALSTLWLLRDSPRRTDATDMHIVHLTASTFFGGPERQMLGLACHLPRHYRTSFVFFAEGGRYAEFQNVVRRHHFYGTALRNDTPRLRAAIHELAETLRDLSADVLLCHGYKPNLLGRVAARRVGIPVVAVSRGWTAEGIKVRLYETADRLNLRFMDRVVAVSDGQAARVRQAGVPSDRIVVIRNAARLRAFDASDPTARQRLLSYFPNPCPLSHLILAAGRLSPEKGFAVLVNAAAVVLQTHPAAGFLLFGEGAERAKLTARIRELGLTNRFVMPGFTDQLDRLLPSVDTVVLPSFTEGLPNVALEASAAGVPVVATSVGGTPEVIVDGETGYLVPPGRADRLAEKIQALLNSPSLRQTLGQAGRQRMENLFTFDAQARAYDELFASLRKNTLCKPLLRRSVDRLPAPSHDVPSVSAS